MSEHPTACTSRVATGEERRRAGRIVFWPAKPHPDIPQLFRGIFYPSSCKRDTQWFSPSAASGAKNHRGRG